MKNKKLLVILGIVGVLVVGGISVFTVVSSKKQKIEVEVTETSTVEKVKPKDDSKVEQEEEEEDAEVDEETKEDEEATNEQDNIESKDVEYSDPRVNRYPDNDGDGKPDELPYHGYGEGTPDTDTSRTGGLSKEDVDKVNNITDEQREQSEEIFNTDQGGVDDTQGR